MSILIRGMEMPKSCWDCDFCHNIPYCDVEDLYRCTAQEAKQIMPLKSERDESCPLEEVNSVDVAPDELIEFANWVAKEACCSDEEWENKQWEIQEILCRKLAKLGIIIVEGDEYIYEYEEET